MRPRSRRGVIAWTAIETTMALALVFLVAATAHKRAPQIVTPGVYAVTATWAAGSDDDVDLYVRDPTGLVCYFNNTNAGLMNLEHDDQGTLTSGSQRLDDGITRRVKFNGERVVVRGVIAGEYTANAQMYLKGVPGPARVRVQLWRLLGDDKLVRSADVTLARTGDQATAFRFTLDARGRLVRVSRLPADLVRVAKGTPAPAVALPSGGLTGGAP